MRDGRIVFDGPSTALSNAFLAELYGDASEELVLPDAPVEPAPARPVRKIARQPASPVPMHA
jgi:phosphonate transport system ATP-binding protein